MYIERVRIPELNIIIALKSDHLRAENHFVTIGCIVFQIWELHENLYRQADRPTDSHTKLYLLPFV